MKDEWWGTLGWWIGTLLKWAAWAVVALVVVSLLAFFFGVHGCDPWPTT